MMFHGKDPSGCIRETVEKSYVITFNGPEPVDYRQSPIDYQHYIDKQLKPVADAILPFIDLDFDSLGDGQLGLFGVSD